MPNIDPTVLNPTQFKNVQQDTTPRELGVIEMLRDSTPLSPIIDDTTEATLNRHSSEIAFTHAALNSPAIATSSVESFTIPANTATSTTLTASKITITAGFQHFRELYDTNVIAGDDNMVNRTRECGKAMGDSLELATISVLDTMRSQFFADTALIGDAGDVWNFNATTDELEVNLAAQGSSFYSRLVAVANRNKSGRLSMNMPDGTNPSDRSPYVIVGNQLGFDKIDSAIQTQGNGQAFTQQFDANLPLKRYVSDNIAVGGAQQLNAYLVSRGALGMVKNFRRPHLEGWNTADWNWGITGNAMPFLGEKVGLLHGVFPADISGNGVAAGEATTSIADHFLFTLKVYILPAFAFNQANVASHVLRVNGATT